MKEVLKSIQHGLSSLGFYTGAIDGVFGWGSYSALLRVLNARNNKADYAFIRTVKAKNIIKDMQKILAENRVYFGEIDGVFGGGSMSAFNHLIPAPKITDAQLKLIYKNCASGFASHINANSEAYKIKTKADLCAFLANNIHESSGFRSLRENMNYKPERLLEVFPKYFKSLSSAKETVAKGQVAICDAVYGGRMGNVKGTRDGYDFRGGGTIHLTGRENYTLCSIGINVPELVKTPDMITQPSIAMKSAMWFWMRNGCSGHANKGNADRTYPIVNGGTNGLKERIDLHAKAWKYIH